MNLAATFPLVLFIYLFIRHIKKPLLALFFFSLLTVILHAIAHLSINNSGFLNLAVVLFVHATPIYLLAGPSFYLFIRLSINGKNISPRDSIHLIPFIIQLVAITPYIATPLSEKINIVQSIINNPVLQKSLDVNLFFSPGFAYFMRSSLFIIYLVFGLFVIAKAQRNNSSRDLSRVNSLKRISWLMILLTVTYSAHILLVANGDDYRNWVINSVIFFDFILFTILFAELSRHPELIYNSKMLRRGYLRESPFLMTQKKENQLPEDIFQAIDSKITAIVKEKKFFANPHNNFDSFARALGQSKYHIRSYLKMKDASFMDLKNKNRIQIAKELLESRRHYKIEYVAHKSGFESLSNFFKIFKRTLKCTPDEYRKMIHAARA